MQIYRFTNPLESKEVTWIPALLKALNISSYREQCSPKPWMKINVAIIESFSGIHVLVYNWRPAEELWTQDSFIINFLAKWVQPELMMNLCYNFIFFYFAFGLAGLKYLHEWSQERTILFY